MSVLIYWIKFAIFKQNIILVNSMLDPSYNMEYLVNIPDVKGMKFVTNSTEDTGRHNILLIEFEEDTEAAAVFTKSSIPSPSIVWTRNALEKTGGKIRGLLVTPTNEPFFISLENMLAIKTTIEQTAKLMKHESNLILHSTNQILASKSQDNDLLSEITNCYEELTDNSNLNLDWYQMANTVLSTKQQNKIVTRYTHISGIPVTINAIANGNIKNLDGLTPRQIYIFTDAKIPADILQTLLTKYVNYSVQSFIDNHEITSNDLILCFATGKSRPHRAITSLENSFFKDFANSLYLVLIEIMKLIIRDQDENKKILEVRANNTAHSKSARILSKTIVRSDLIRRMILDNQFNWEGIVNTIGASGEIDDITKLYFMVGDYTVIENGRLSNNYQHQIDEIQSYLDDRDITLTFDLNDGKKSAIHWGYL